MSSSENTRVENECVNAAVSENAGNGAGLAAPTTTVHEDSIAEGVGEPADQTISTEQQPSPSSNSEAVHYATSRRRTGPRTTTGKQRSRRNAITHGIFSSLILLNGESADEFRSLVHGMKQYFRPVGAPEELVVDKLTSIIWRDRRALQVELKIEKESALVGSQQIQEDRWDDVTLHMLLLEKFSRSDLYNTLRNLDKLRSNLQGRGFQKHEDERIGIHIGQAGFSIFKRIFDRYEECAAAAELYSKERDQGHGMPPDTAIQTVIEYITNDMKKLEELECWIRDREIHPVYSDAPSQTPSEGLERLIRYEAHLSREFDRNLNRLDRLRRMRLGQSTAPPINLQITE